MPQLNKLQLAETLGQSLLQLGYAFASMKPGAGYAGPLKFNKTDWESRFDRILDEKKQQMVEAKAEQEFVTKEEKRASQLREDDAKKKISTALRMYEDNMRKGREFARQNEQLAKKAPTDDKAKEKLLANIAKEQEKIRADFRAIEGYEARIGEAKNDKERAALMANIFTKLKQPEDGTELTIEELKDLEESRRGFVTWAKGMFSTQPDKFKDYINKVKEDRLRIVGAAATGVTTAQNSDNNIAGDTASSPGAKKDGLIIVAKGDTVIEIDPSELAAAEANGYKRVN
jgi:hypothetical protein